MSSSRQSTLDRFIQKAGPSARPDDQIDREIDQDNVEETERDDKFQRSGRASYVEIDTEAAKTWIYPGFVHYYTFRLPLLFVVMALGFQGFGLSV